MSNDWKRIGIMIGLLLLFGSIFAEATNYIIINRGTDLNLSNISFNYSGTIPASNITAGTFGTEQGGGDFTFPNNLTVMDNIVINGNSSLIGLLTLNSYPYCTIKTNGSGGIICGTDLNYYPTSVSIDGNDIKTLQIARDSLGNISTTFTDLIRQTNGFYIYNSTMTDLLFNESQLNQTILSIISTNTTGITSLPASNISAGTFGSNVGNGNYTFPEYLEISKHINVTGNESNSTFYGDITVIGKIYGGSPVKIAGGLNVTTGDSWFGNITVEKCIGCEIINGTNINADNISAQNLYVNQTINLPNNSIIDAYINSMNANKLFNLSALDYEILISQDNITGGLTIPYSNITGLPNVTTYNESGIARNYSMTGTGTGSLPDWDIIYIDGVIKPMTNGSLVFLFNNDTTPSYLYRRVQGLAFLYQAVTVNPQQNITLEQYVSDKERAISIIIKRTPTQILGEFYITSYYNSTYAPYKTMGSFSYKNTTNVNTFSISPTLSADSYLIVKSETL